MVRTCRTLVVLVFVGSAVLLTAPPVDAGQYVDVTALRQFSRECNYMSHAGYLRWMSFREQGVWLSMAEASRIVQEQMRAR